MTTDRSAGVPARNASRQTPDPRPTHRTGPPYVAERGTVARQVRVDTYRARGAGGQHVNRTESAVRMTHLPSGVVVTASDTRSQIRNREIALVRLIEKLQRLNRVPKRRLPTRAGSGARKRRLQAKKQRAEIKRMRGKVYDE